jgi:hypothetical protein
MKPWLLLCALPALAGDPSLFYSKSFPGSTPPYMEVRLAADGSVEYRETPDEAALRFKLKEAELKPVLELTAKLDNFSRPLESGLPVARMGEKTFRYEKDGEKKEVKFNYSQDLDAQALLEWFERITESARYYYDLERAVKFDRLGVNHAILKLESAWDRQRLVAVDLFEPLLNRVIKNDVYLNMARERAAKLAEAFRAGPPKPKTP